MDNDTAEVMEVDLPVAFGEMTLMTKDTKFAPTKYDRIAYDNHARLMLLSIVGEANKVRAIRAFLNSKSKAYIEAAGYNQSDGKAWKPSDPYRYRRSPGRLYVSDAGYKMYLHRLDHGLVQSMFVCKEEGFMPLVSDETLWRELTDTRFTTPILREWVPYIRKQLEERGLLHECFCYRCNCGELVASTKHIDIIVSDGLSDGSIVIPSAPEYQPEPLNAQPALEGEQ